MEKLGEVRLCNMNQFLFFFPSPPLSFSLIVPSSHCVYIFWRTTTTLNVNLVKYQIIYDDRINAIYWRQIIL